MSNTALPTAFQVLPFVSSTPVFRETITDQVYTAGQQVELMLPQAFGGTAPLSYTLTPIPNGLTFNAADRVLTGTPDMATTVTLTYTATDSAATPTSTALTFMVTVSQNPIVSIADVDVNEEDGAATVTVSVDTAVAGGFTVNASTTEGTATSGEDYTAVTNQMLIFDGTATEATFTVPIIDDAVVEGAETLRVSLSDLQVTGGTTVTLPDTPATVTINDDDTASLTLTPATLTVTEGGIATFTVSVDNAVQGGFTVAASTTDGTATSGGRLHSRQQPGADLRRQHRRDPNLYGHHPGRCRRRRRRNPDGVAGHRGPYHGDGHAAGPGHGHHHG